MYEILINQCIISEEEEELLPEAGGRGVGWRLPAQALGEQLGEGGGGGAGGRRGGRACAGGVVGPPLAHGGADTQLDQEPKELCQSPAQAGRSWRDGKMGD